MVKVTGVHKRADASIQWYTRSQEHRNLEEYMAAEGKLLSHNSILVDEFTQQNTAIFLDRESYEYWENHPDRIESSRLRKIYNEENGIISTQTIEDVSL